MAATLFEIDFPLPLRGILSSLELTLPVKYDNFKRLRVGRWTRNEKANWLGANNALGIDHLEVPFCRCRAPIRCADLAAPLADPSKNVPRPVLSSRQTSV